MDAAHEDFYIGNVNVSFVFTGLPFFVLVGGTCEVKYSMTHERFVNFVLLKHSCHHRKRFDSISKHVNYDVIKAYLYAGISRNSQNF